MTRTKLTLAVVAVAVCVSLLQVTTKSEEKKMTEKNTNMTLNALTPEEERVIVDKGTERPFSGKYYKFNEDGTYTCKRCGAPLFRSSDKFDSGCGWPSFDDEVSGAIKRSVDADGSRTEITCSRCGAHLGHVFEGEGFTDRNVRHCVNSISLDFLPASGNVKTETAYFAGGCFWGTEYLLEQVEGVKSVRSGYMGGHKANPTYKEVCTGSTGHAETVEVVYDPTQTDYETLAKYFFEIHDPTQINRQGPDVGNQYRSAVFYIDDNQRRITEKLIKILRDKGYKVVTEVAKADNFWVAEGYHQDYYTNNGQEPYCHFYQQRF